MQKIYAAFLGSLIITVAAGAMCGAKDESIVLTPTNLYFQIDDLAKREARVTAALSQRVHELERKVAGMQKQITILHAKKADK